MFDHEFAMERPGRASCSAGLAAQCGRAGWCAISKSEAIAVFCCSFREERVAPCAAGREWFTTKARRHQGKARLAKRSHKKDAQQGASGLRVRGCELFGRAVSSRWKPPKLTASSRLAGDLLTTSVSTVTIAWSVRQNAAERVRHGQRDETTDVHGRFMFNGCRSF